MVKNKLNEDTIDLAWLDEDYSEDMVLEYILSNEEQTINLKDDANVQKLFAGIIDEEITSKDLPPLNAEEKVL